MSTGIDQLVQAAGLAANTGRWAEAEKLWREIQQLNPRHPQALFSLGAHALQRGDRAGAIKLLGEARAVAPRDLLVLLTLATAQQLSGDAAAENAAIDAALAADPYYIPALLAKGSWLERQGNRVGAASCFANALKISPPSSHWPAHLRPQLEHAKKVVDDHAGRFAAH